MMIFRQNAYVAIAHAKPLPSQSFLCTSPIVCNESKFPRTGSAASLCVGAFFSRLPTMASFLSRPPSAPAIRSPFLDADSTFWKRCYANHWTRGAHSDKGDGAPSISMETGGGGTDGNGGDHGGNGGGGRGDGDESDDEFLDISSAEELAAAKGIEIPEDYAAAARDGGLRSSVLNGYAAIATGSTLTGMLAKSIPAFRDRLVADRLYFFKILAEVSIDSACATVAELRKRGDEFWSEFEFYLSDLIVGLVLDVVLVSLLAPVAVPGRTRKLPSKGLRAWSAKLPSASFAKSEPGKRFSISDRIGCYVARALEYSLAGMTCGFVGQAMASGLMVAKRKYMGASADDVAVPPVFQTALVWGAFMGLSANTRYQIVFGLERIVDETIARRVPQIAYLTTTIIRFANNVVGGEQFIDMARWAGVQ